MKPVTEARISKNWMQLQTLFFKLPKRERKPVDEAMRILDRVRADMRHAAILAAGARARKPEPVFRGSRLGSMECMTFYDGYASTHPGFVNPYRRKY